MPKKTKKQKILAQLHRKLKLASQTADFKLNSDFVKSQNNIGPMKAEAISSVSVSNVKEIFTKPKIERFTTSYGYVKNDLIKITIFTVFALGLDGVLYFLLRTR